VSRDDHNGFKMDRPMPSPHAAVQDLISGARYSAVAVLVVPLE